MNNFLVYLVVMASVTYLIRMLPLVLVKRRIRNRFLISFLYYIPYSVLAVMTIPAIFTSTGNIASSTVGLITAFVFAYLEKSLVTVAAFSCFFALVTEMLVAI